MDEGERAADALVFLYLFEAQLGASPPVGSLGTGPWRVLGVGLVPQIFKIDEYRAGVAPG